MGCTPDSCTPTIRFTQLYWFHPPSVWRKQKTDFFTSALISIPPVSSGAHLRTSASCFCVSNVSFQLVFPSALNIYFDLNNLKKKKKKLDLHSTPFSFPSYSSLLKALLMPVSTSSSSIYSTIPCDLDGTPSPPLHTITKAALAKQFTETFAVESSSHVVYSSFLIWPSCSISYC